VNCAADLTGGGGAAGSCPPGEYLAGISGNMPDCRPSFAPPRTFTIPSSNPVSLELSLVVGSDGLPFFVQGALEGTALAATHCDNPVCSARTTSYFNLEFGVAGRLPSVAIRPDGVPSVAFMGATAGVALAYCNELACTSDTVVNAVDAAATITAYPSLLIGGDSLPLIVYANGAQLKAAKCSTIACSGSKTITVLDATANPVAIAMALGSDLKPVIVYGNTAGAKVVRCANLACSGGTTSQTLESGPGVTAVSIAIGGDGYPVIGYTRQQVGPAHVVAKCADVACSMTQKTFLALASSGTADKRPIAVAIGGDQLPVLAYTKLEGGLRVERCTEATCSGTRQAGGSPELGFNVSNVALASGADGLPLLAWFDYGSKVATFEKCLNRACQ
jgi:hypothetical protein